MGKLSQVRHSTGGGGLNKWSIELTRLSQRSVFNFNFNFIQRALVLEDYAPALRVAGFVSRKKCARREKKRKKGKIIIVGKMIIYIES